MELSCESGRFPENRRPISCKFVELHVLFVPDDQWNVKLNKVPAEAIEHFISAGFIRVYPDVTLKTLRNEMAALLGPERRINTFSFLRCVGRSLALVKSKQERDLKVKTFAPPYASQPELYLLPTGQIDSSVCSQSLTPDTGSSSPDQHIYYHQPKTCRLPTGTKEAVKFPLIPQCSHQPPPTPSLEEEEEEDEDEDSGEEEEQSLSCSVAEREHEEEGLSSRRPEWAEQESRGSPRFVSPTKASQHQDGDLFLVKDLPAKKESYRKKHQHHRRSRAARDSGVAESAEDGDSGFSLIDGLRKSIKSTKTKAAVLSRPVRCTSPPPGLDSASDSQNPDASRGFQTSRNKVIEEIKLVREERKQLEWTRQELLRKGKDLLALNRHRRNQARDTWKKRYFETKKATAPLEDKLRNVRQELETFYNKLLHQLQARDNRGKPKRQGRTSIKNGLIIQIMTESHEIDNLRRKVEDAKMKLVAEMKLRKQAATELKALKAELAQKKSQSSRPGLAASLGSRNRLQAQTTAHPACPELRT
ncbi:spermatogenesis-associated protein 1 [Betta splendens]|uniref:Spermatogenesis-associated protein 1 n=1 Tax=Betta splendens TaxID=158456 RepID=A0A6P7MEE7_BETSP|nr:spermatogenesis-associated protein 1 [Betta splendens]XP_055363918.1 spermatogenesis-associated protein 1 [Betta splendens]